MKINGFCGLKNKFKTTEHMQCIRNRCKREKENTSACTQAFKIEIHLRIDKIPFHLTAFKMKFVENGIYDLSERCLSLYSTLKKTDKNIFLNQDL